MKTYDGGTLSGTTITGTPVAEQDWGLDALGNWGTYTQNASGSATLNQTRSHNTANEISTIGIVSGGTGTDWIDPTYDLAGNRVTGPYPLSPNLSLTMTYDAWNRLVRVQLNGTIQIFAAEYDGLGRRIVRTDEGMTRRSYYNESWQELEVRKEASAGVEDTDPMEQFVWHPYYIDALATRFYDANTTGSQTQHYFTHDANFNVTAAINTSGNVVERYDYTPYGQPFILEPNFSADPDGTDIGNGYLYTGRYYDRTLGLYHYRHRTYDPAVGTFLTRDPIGYEGSKGNLYEYVGGGPVDLTDALGQTPNGRWMDCGGGKMMWVPPGCFCCRGAVHCPDPGKGPPPLPCSRSACLQGCGFVLGACVIGCNLASIHPVGRIGFPVCIRACQLASALCVVSCARCTAP